MEWFNSVIYPEYFFSYTDDFLYVISKKTGKVLKPTRNGVTTYHKYQLIVNGESKTLYYHRLLAHLLIPNPHFKKEIHHIDGNPENNKIDNLMWVSRFENQQNLKKYKNNSTGITNISYKVRDNSWCYSKCYDGKRVEKSFKTLQGAEAFKKSHHYDIYNVVISSS